MLTTVVWPKGQIIHRLHLEQYRASQFNPGMIGNARFSPIRDTAAQPIPTLYGGTTFDCAAMETVFHDVPFAAGLKTYDTKKLEGQVYSQIVSGEDLLLADLSSTALRKLGLQRNQLIDTEKDRYPQTRPWAEAVHAQFPQLHGLCWISRQDDRARAIMLFGDRLSTGALLPIAPSITITTDIGIYGDVVDLANRIGVKLVGRKF